MSTKKEFKKNIKSSLDNTQKDFEDILKNKTDGIYKLYEKIEEFHRKNPIDIYKENDLYKRKIDLWDKLSDEWSKVLSKQIIKYLQEDFTDAMSNEIFKLISDLETKIDRKQDRI